ncbi:class I SAM-dependent DNA methyltransferase [Chromatium okenii]|uniref:site-specific DNA-methyltransferase (adenine-specific) n=1 Tax=Chromatium okenii TaxID=61644 RepID=A0A2S7XRH6_9GAMM|nr:DNA methyltransferase [Chromatium okenii]PQJ96068.1 class I SAM-dependent DNA methyltransferase [Chromatium okenii]
MTPDEFIAKWQSTTLKERSAAQEHFLDLCQLLNEPTPASIDPTGDFYCFEKGAKKTTGGDGWADVWKRDHFGWEYKGKRKNLNDAFIQLHRYAPALENPPLLIVSDMERIIIHTAFNGTVSKVHSLALEDLRIPAKLQLLKWAFSEPERLRPTLTTAALTENAARQFGELAQTLRQRGHDTQQIAHFCQQILFCFFAEDIGLLPNKSFSKLLEIGQKRLEHLPLMLTNLFNTMATGGFFGTEEIDWFNGGLFDAVTPLPLTRDDVRMLRELARLNWSAIEPSIFGTLFERGLDPNQREQLGAHYTDPASIMRLVNPVVLDPLREEWRLQKIKIAALMKKADAAKSTITRNKTIKSAQALLSAVFERLQNFRVLDPACGSGNFLLLALRGLKNLEHDVILDAERLGLPRSFTLVGPENVLGIELNSYAAELARVTVWIGEIQWMLNHGFSLAKNPILKTINIIDQRDAVVNADGSEPNWPTADVIVGNPPFLGGSKKRGVLGDDYFSTLGTIYAGRIPAGADLVTYWFEKARSQIETKKANAAGLVSTNSIRGGANRQVLERICKTTTIFNAWSDEPWINSGAAVRVSLICFGNTEVTPVLNGEKVAAIYADLTESDNDKKLNLTTAKLLLENNNVSFEGTKKYGAFDISGDLARSWLAIPNPHGLPTSNVVKPWRNGKDIASRASDTWIIDFGLNTSEIDAALYEFPFQHLLNNVKPYRDTVRRERTRKNWWIHEEARSGMRKALTGLSRYLCTPRVAKYRFFVWLDKTVLPDTRLVIVARSDDMTFGILSSQIHQIWSLATCSWHGDGNEGGRPTYNAKSCFETFPFPMGLTPADTGSGIETLDSGAIIPTVAAEYRDHAVAIAEAAFQLNQLRENWLNPPEWIERVPEVVAGYPDRIIAKPTYAALLKQRTLTNLYNKKPAWLVNEHVKLDQAVAAAYGWSNELSETEVLQQLLALNKARSS